MSGPVDEEEVEFEGGFPDEIIDAYYGFDSYTDEEDD